MLEVILICVLIFLLVVLSMVWPPDSPWTPWWRTSAQKAQLVWKLVPLSKKDIVYELGSGDAAVLREAARFGAGGVGVEVDPARVFISRVIIWFNNLSNKIEIRRGNFFGVDISPASVIFVYLVPRVLLKLKPKFLKELKSGTKIISYVYTIDYLPLIKKDEKNKIYVYKIPRIT